MRVTWGENIGMALSGVWTHRFRSALTILGIVVGITTVVTVASLLTGLRRGIVSFFQEFGPDNIFVFKTSGDPNAPVVPPKEERRKPIRPEYAEIIRRTCPSVQDTAITLFIPPVVRGRALVAKVPGTDSNDIFLSGASANSFALAPRNLRAGRLFTAEEDARAARVVVLGSEIADALYPDGRPIGRPVLVDGAEFIILGVFEKAKGGFFGENGMDREITMPLRTAQVRYPQLDRYMITAKARPGLRQSAYEEVEAMLRKLRRTPPGRENDFAIATADQIIRQFDSIVGLVIMVSIAISALGLLVGGIGVMNIMLVTVTERTREIGVRKAIGARRRDIVAQFLVEAMTLTGTGGLLGILLAVGVTFLVNALVPALPSQVPPWAIFTAFSVSVSIGLFFGVWPALKASRLDPVEALRYE